MAEDKPASRLLPRLQAAQRSRDLAAVDREARKLGQYPLDPTTRNFRADLRQAVRDRRASAAAKRGPSADLVVTDEEPQTYPHTDHLHMAEVPSPHPHVRYWAAPPNAPTVDEVSDAVGRGQWPPGWVEIGYVIDDKDTP
jgi:hypothetical protein